MATTKTAPFSSGAVYPETQLTSEALNRFRMIHSDRDVRALVRKLNRLPHLAEDQDRPLEEEAASLDIDKWQFSVERQLAAVRNLERQAQSYTSRAGDTRRRNDELKAALEEEKKLLAEGLAEREQRMKCDEVAKRIVARGKTRAELDEQISTLEASLVEHRANYEAVVAVATARAENFTKITALVEEARQLKLPTWIGNDEEDVAPEPVAEATKPSLNATTLPFQPSAANARGPASAPVSRAGSASPHPQPHHSLPQRPGGARGGQAPPSRYPPGRGALPARPSNLRHLTKQASITGSLEDGEVEDEEKRGSKRKAEESGGRGERGRRK